MREVLFRGQRVDNKDLVYGGVVFGKSGKVYIFRGEDLEFVEDDLCVVKPETVSQFTGVKDKNDNKIFEGDKVKAFGNIYEVVFNDGAFYLKRESVHHRLSRVIQDLEIIGNIHEDGNK